VADIYNMRKCDKCALLLSSNQQTIYLYCIFEYRNYFQSNFSSCIKFGARSVEKSGVIHLGFWCSRLSKSAIYFSYGELASSPSTPLLASKMSAITHRRLPPGEVNCKWWMRGYCSRGSSCYFKHDATMFAAETRQAQSPSTSSSIRLPNVSDSRAGECMPATVLRIGSLLIFITATQTCAICFERPDTYGLLVNCGHAFCLGMLSQWD
jgi:hypothetical protein